jgi:hypothetical protein
MKGNGYSKSFSKKDEDERRAITEASCKRARNGYNHNQRPKGIVYSSFAIENENVYIIDSDHTVKVRNEMKYQHNQITTIQVRYLKSTDNTVSRFHSYARKLADTWKNEGNKCRRECVKGGMKHFGVKVGSGNMEQFCYQPTQHNPKNVNAIHKELNILGKKITAMSFPDVHQSIHTEMKNLHKTVPSYLGGELGLCCELTQSQHSLVTESHVDQDLSKSFSIWSVEEGHNENPPGWYFVFPYLKCVVNGKQYHGIAVKLKHGTAIEWNGRVIFHCTTGPIEREVNGIGTFFGITVV